MVVLSYLPPTLSLHNLIDRSTQMCILDHSFTADFARPEPRTWIMGFHHLQGLCLA